MKKQQYFEKGATALKNIAKVDDECYCCPICSRLYVRGDLEAGLLTLEHAPPEKVGGKPLALTCKECNSVAGYSIDSAVVNRQRQLDFANALVGQTLNFKGRATFSIGGETLNISLVRDQGTVSIIPQEKVNDPKKLKAYQDYMMRLYKNGEFDGEPFNITPDIAYHIRYSTVGDLKAAFIICFAFFGYRFALHDRLSLVRKQIINYKESVINHYWHSSDPTIAREHFIFLVEKPVAALAVKLDNSTIILPWLEGPKEFYRYFEDYFTHKEPFTLEGRFFDWPHTLEMRLDFMK